MEAIKEITNWDNDMGINHIYLMDGGKAIAYIPEGIGKPFYFNSGIPIDRRGRKFVKADTNLFNAAKSDLIEVIGSKGDSYWVDPVAKTCTCTGFLYRGKCKHLNML